MYPILIVLIISLVWLMNRWRIRNHVRLAYQLPSNKLQTWLGWGPTFSHKEVLDYFNKYSEKYGPVSILWCGPFPILLLSKPEIIEEVLTAKNCVNKPDLIYGGLEFALGKSLITLSDPEWSRHRKLFNKAFSNTNLIAFTPIFRKEISCVMKNIRENLKLGKTVDMHSLFRSLTVKTSFTTMLKRDFEDIPYDVNDVINQTLRAQNYAADRCVNPFLKVDFIAYLAEMTIYRESVEAINIFNKYFQESLKNIKNVSLDVVTPMDIAFAAEQRKLLNSKEIVDDLLSIFVGAYDTSLFTLYATICMLAMHHECQQKVYEEVISIWPNLTDNDGKITFEQVNQMVYLDMVLNETMRVLPAVPLVFRTVSDENLKLSTGETLPVGTTIAIDIYRTHHNKDVWGPKADYFNPENFSPSSVEQRHPYAFIPFTKGQRFCIGYRYSILLLKIALAELITNFKFDTDFKYEDIRVYNHVSSKFIEHPIIKVEERVPKTFKAKG